MKDLYTTDKYISLNPSLHSEDSLWKIEQIIPLIDAYLTQNSANSIVILDVGGGNGLILNSVARYIKEKYNRKMIKYALDLSPGMLEQQKKMNPDLRVLANQDIRKTSFKNKEIDLVLMIDVLEHIDQYKDALQEINRIAKYAIFKVPLEDNLTRNMSNVISRGKVKQKTKDKYGHVVYFSFKRVKKEIEISGGKVISYHFTNVSEYLLKNPHHSEDMKFKDRVKNRVAALLFKLSPRLCSALFDDFATILVRY